LARTEFLTLKVDAGLKSEVRRFAREHRITMSECARVALTGLVAWKDEPSWGHDR
jgi:hypothetical protein